LAIAKWQNMMYNVGNCGGKWGITLQNAPLTAPKWVRVAQMFLGEYLHNIDGKGRLTLPARFRAELAKGVVVTRGLDGCLFVYPVDEWEKLAQRINGLPLTKKDARTLARLIYSRASACAPDKQGRILLPTYLREFATLDGETVVIGLYTRLEIWNPERWQQVRNDVEERGDAIAEHLAELGI
jgi:MraZ protein